MEEQERVLMGREDREGDGGRGSASAAFQRESDNLQRSVDSVGGVRRDEVTVASDGKVYTLEEELLGEGGH
jgi:hypothetical protein